MYSEEGIAKLTDFGIAQLGNEKQLGLTQAGSILGSILYIPPEQLVDSRRVDNKADIYSLGVTLFQLFTGKLPFEGNSVAEVVTKILNTEAPSMKDYDSSIPKALDRVILKAIKKDPSLRYQDVSEFGKDLTEIYEKLKIRKTKELLNNVSNSSLDKTVIINPKNMTTLPKNKNPTEKLDEKKIELKENNNKDDKKDNSHLMIILGAIFSIILIVSLLMFLFSDNTKEDIPVKEEPIQKEIKEVPIKKEEPIQKETVKQEIKEKPLPKEPVKQEIKNEIPKQEIKKEIIKPVVKKVEQKPVIRYTPVPKPVVKKQVPIKKPVVKKVEQKPVSKPVVKKQENNSNIGEGY